ncbi:unnamed protein product [Pleuronectes platessa]|uniref:Uncharacterized protein n=1 Tax=Pleuronectes platessa TaxID=8262 RepID=A0A9N7ZDW1_PLEPL|nr:unnamed protein product [Pleuronectes platessa]
MKEEKITKTSRVKSMGERRMLDETGESGTGLEAGHVEVQRGCQSWKLFTPDAEATPKRGVSAAPSLKKQLAPIHSHVKPLCCSHRTPKRREVIVSASSLFFSA